MPPRFAFWTIILDGTPTSFRTRERDEILPLFNQLKAKNPDALLKWFSGGRLWDSPEQAREVRALEKVKRFREERTREERTRQPRDDHSRAMWGPGASAPGSPKAPVDDPLAEFRRQHGRPADGSDDPSTRPWNHGASRPSERRETKGAARPPKADRRGKDWRPGGEHRDPRDKYKLAPGEARKRWKERNLGPRPSTRDGQGRPLRTNGPKRTDERAEGERAFKPKPRDRQPGAPRRPFGAKPFGGKPRGPTSPGGQRFGRAPKGPRGPRGRG